MIDLRHRVLEWAELKRRVTAGEQLTAAEQATLDEGISPKEYREQIIDMIRHERRSAEPVKKVREAKRQATLRVVQPLTDFLTQEHGNEDNT